MKPRLRLFYCAMIASFVPFLTKSIISTNYPNFNYYYKYNIIFGILNGSMLCSLILSYKNIPLILGASFIGGINGVIYSAIF